MTIVVGAASPDGLVLASDSRLTAWVGEHSRIASDHNHKLFSLGDHLAVATYGDAFVGAKTIDGLMDEFVALSRAGPDSRDLEDAISSLGEFFDQRFIAALKEDGSSWDVDEQGWPLGFLVAGYDAEGVGHIREVLVPGPHRPEESAISTSDRGLLWRGQTDVIRRLVLGVDWTELILMDLDLSDEAMEAMRELEYIALAPATVQDAIDYAAFLIRTTIEMQRFSDGLIRSPGRAPDCGGPIQIVAVTRGGLHWISRPTLSAPVRSEWIRDPTRPGAD